jgi:HAD superfamily phosphatase (TIGR01668 family)
MLNYLSPDFYFSKFSDITPEFLKKNNIKTMLIDVDNTLAPYEQAQPDEKILSWLDSLKQNEIGFAFISNNSSDERIRRFNQNIGAPAFAKSGKPFAGKNIQLALEQLGGEKQSTAFLGDQVFTDVCAGKFNGMRAILVPPIKDLTNLFFRTKRFLEKPFLRSYRRREEKRKKDNQ